MSFREAQRTGRPRPRSRLGSASSFWSQRPLASAAPCGSRQVGAVSLQSGPPGRFCGLTAQSYLGRKGGSAVRSWVVGVVWGLMAQGPLPSLELGGGCWLAVRSSLVLGSQGDPHHAPCTFQAAGPRKATTPTIPGPGRVREMDLPYPAPRSRALHCPPSQASSPSSFDRSHRCFCRAAGLCHRPSGDEGHGALVCSARLCRKGLITN